MIFGGEKKVEAKGFLIYQLSLFHDFMLVSITKVHVNQLKDVYNWWNLNDLVNYIYIYIYIKLYGPRMLARSRASSPFPKWPQSVSTLNRAQLGPTKHLDDISSNMP